MKALITKTWAKEHLYLRTVDLGNGRWGRGVAWTTDRNQAHVFGSFASARACIRVLGGRPDEPVEVIKAAA